jgi:deoxyribose-phosphate aldolase
MKITVRDLAKMIDHSLLHPTMTDMELKSGFALAAKYDVAFVKTSTGYGFVKQDNGMYSYAGATVPHLKLMRKHSKPSVQIKAAGGVRTLKDLLLVRSIGITRVGATATSAMLDEAEKRIAEGEDLSELVDRELAGGAY